MNRRWRKKKLFKKIDDWVQVSLNFWLYKLIITLTLTLTLNHNRFQCLQSLNLKRENNVPEKTNQEKPGKNVPENNERRHKRLLLRGVYQDVFWNLPTSWVSWKSPRKWRKSWIEILISTKWSTRSPTDPISTLNQFRVSSLIHYLWIQDIFLLYSYVQDTFSLISLIILTRFHCSTTKSSIGISINP